MYPAQLNWLLHGGPQPILADIIQMHQPDQNPVVAVGPGAGAVGGQPLVPGQPTQPVTVILRPIILRPTLLQPKATTN